MSLSPGGMAVSKNVISNITSKSLSRFLTESATAANLTAKGECECSPGVQPIFRRKKSYFSQMRGVGLSIIKVVVKE